VTTALILVPGTGTRQNEEEVESTGSCKENSWDESRSLFERTALSLIPKTAPNFTAPSDDVVTQRFYRVSRGEGPCCVPLFSCGHPGDAKVESPLQLFFLVRPAYRCQCDAADWVEPLVDDRFLLITNEVQWREAFLYNVGARVLPEGHEATDEFDRAWGAL
jgi:hypothetical protein